MKPKSIILLLVQLLVFLNAIGQASIMRKNFRITAYVELDDTVKDRTVPFDNIDYLNIAFCNPDHQGNLMLPDGAKAMIDQSKTYSNNNHHIRVMAVVGGKDAPAHILHRLIDADHREEFIKGVIEFLKKYGLSGVDIDFEKGMVNNDFPDFMKALGQAFQKDGEGFEVTAAVGTDSFKGKDYITPETWRYTNFINIMSYDEFADNREAQEASYELAEQDLLFWHKQMGIPPDSLGLGVPFYGYMFENGRVKGKNNEFPYRNVVLINSSAAESDTIILNNHSVVIYNGLSMIRRKAKLSLDQSNGIMIWLIDQDAPSPYSLLDAILKTIKMNGN